MKSSISDLISLLTDSDAKDDTDRNKIQTLRLLFEMDSNKSKTKTKTKNSQNIKIVDVLPKEFKTNFGTILGKFWKLDCASWMYILISMFRSTDINGKEEKDEKDENEMDVKNMLKLVCDSIDGSPNVTVYQYIFVEAIERAGININDVNCNYLKDVAPLLLKLITKEEIDEYANGDMEENETQDIINDNI